MIKMKKSNMAIAFSVVALILGSVLAGLAGCQNPITGRDLGGTPTTGVNTGVTGGTGSYTIPHIALYWDGNEAAERTGDTITWPAYDLGAQTPATVTRTAKAVFKHPPEGFEYLQWTFETDTNAAADGLLAFGDAWHTGAQDRDSSEMPISAGLGVTKAKITVWNCDSTGKRGKVSSSFTLDVVEFGTAIPPSLKISWDGDNLSHNGETLTWWKDSVPLDLRAAISDPPANPQVRWTISGSADAVVFDGYTAGSPVAPDIAVKIKPGVNFGTGTVTITAALEGYTGITESFTIIPGPIPVSSVTVTPKTLKLSIGESSALTAAVLPTDADNPTVVWTSETPGVATVNSATGRVTAVAMGQAVIRATAGDQSDTCMVTVTLPNSVLSGFSITGGYEGPATISDINGNTLSVTVNAAGDLEYDPSLTAPTGDVMSITLNKPGLAGGDKKILIGRDPLSDSNKIELNINGDGVLAFRPTVNGITPIGSYAEFQLINADATKLDGKYKLETDLNLMDKDWTPVGGSAKPFTGTFDGDGHTLSNLLIKSTTTEPVGLFGTVGGTVKNLDISSGEVSGGGSVGGVVGLLTGTIEGCSSTADVSSSGGTASDVVGENDGGTMN
ncbi:hypothetical protein AGMMS49991_07170 [Spirochaetia bacterium]|nr:hypothetical protein AGMMS49991_07170 [Spirochaetia bacterium]